MHVTLAPGRIQELVLYFLRLGFLGFGGPVALVGQMERELVADRGWLTKEQMREAIAVCQSLPGPLAIQVGIYVSYLRGGFWGAWAGGWAFILPNFVIVARVGCALRVPRRSATCHRDFLWREPRRDRAYPAFLPPAGEAWDGGLAAMGACGRVSGRHRHTASRSGAAVHRLRDYRYWILRKSLPPATSRGIADFGSAHRGTTRARGVRLNVGEASAVFPESGLADLR